MTLSPPYSTAGGDIDHDRQIASVVPGEAVSIDPHLRFAHDGLEMEEQPLAPPLLAGREVFAVPHLALIIDAAAGFGRQVFDPVGERDERPGPIVEIALSGSLGRPAVETPCRIHVIDSAPRAGEFVKPRRRELRPVSHGRRIGPGERLCRSKARERQTGGGHKGTKDGSHMDEIVVCHAVAGPVGDTGATAAGLYFVQLRIAKVNVN